MRPRLTHHTVIMAVCVQELALKITSALAHLGGQEHNAKLVSGCYVSLIFSVVPKLLSCNKDYKKSLQATIFETLKNAKYEGYIRGEFAKSARQVK